MTETIRDVYGRITNKICADLEQGVLALAAGARSREALRARAAIMRAVRAYFESEGFVEVETPSRVRAPSEPVANFKWRQVCELTTR